MCLNLNKNHKPVQSRTRKTCYKVVFEARDNHTSFMNLFYTAKVTEYVLNKEIESNRQYTELTLQEKMCGIDKGFHMLKTVKDAKRFIAYAKSKETQLALAYGSYNYAVFAILKCNVDPINHVADGTFPINIYNTQVDGGFTEIVEIVNMPCTAYTKITPIKKVYSETLKD